MRLLPGLTLVGLFSFSSCMNDGGPCEAGFDHKLYGCKTYPVLTVDTSMKDWFKFDSAATFCMKNDSGRIHCWVAQGGWEFDTLLHDVYRRDDYQRCGIATCHDEAYFQSYSISFSSTESPLSIRLGVKKNFTEEISDSTAVMNLGDIRTVRINYGLHSYKKADFPAAESLQQLGKTNYGFIAHSSLVLHGISFSDVFEITGPVDSPTEIQACYFTKTQGLVGFKLQSGELWRLD